MNKISLIIKNNKFLLVFLLFLFIGLSIYANSFVNKFFWDDDDLIVNNAYVKDWSYLPDFFTQNLIAGTGQLTNYYRPVLLISFSLDYHLWGLNPIGFHLTNTMLHVISAFLVFVLLSILFNRLKKGRRKLPYNYDILAFLVSLVFLSHPLQTEAVTYVAGRADPLSTFFSLLALLTYLAFRLGEGRRKIYYVLCLVFFVLGILSKEQTILLPAVILLIDWVFLASSRARFKKKNIFKYLKIIGPLFLISLVYFILHLTVLNFKDGADFLYNQSAYDSSSLTRVFTFFFVVLSYFKLLFVPTNLHMAREISPISSIFSWPVISFLVFSCLAVFTAIKTWKISRLPSFGLLWFFILLLPRTNIIAINRPMYEHWLYFPMIGFWIAVFSLAAMSLQNIKAKNKNIFVYLVLIIFLISLAGQTILRNRDWRDPITFYEYNLQYTPNSAIQHNNLGMSYANKQRYDEAIAEYQQAIELEDIYPQVHYNLANALINTGKTEEGIAKYQELIRNFPKFSLAYYNLMLVYQQQGELSKAEEIRKKLQLILEKND